MATGLDKIALSVAVSVGALAGWYWVKAQMPKVEFTVVNNAKDIPCAVIGDSIADMIGSQLKECITHAKVGVPSGTVVGYVVQNVEWTVVSAGSNDPDNPNLHKNLDAIRAQTHQTIWILPQSVRAAGVVQSVAKSHGDAVVSFAGNVAKDGVHPKYLTPIATEIRRLMNNGEHNG